MLSLSLFLSVRSTRLDREKKWIEKHLFICKDVSMRVDTS